MQSHSRIKTGDPQRAFDTIERIWTMLELPIGRERSFVKAQQQRAADLIAVLKQSIPPDVSQQRARTEIPILAKLLKDFVTPVTHKRYTGGRGAVSALVGKSLLHIQSVLGEEYVAKKHGKKA